MSPCPENTPPPSPAFGELQDDDVDEIIEDEVAEVIELDYNLEEGVDDELDEGMSTPPEDNSELTFSQHTKGVFTAHFHPREHICATGGEDDRAFVWNWKTGQIVMETPTFKDSVLFARFNNDGGMLAVADMAGSLKVYRMNGARPKEVVWEFETSDLNWMEWHHGANVLFAGTSESELWMWKIPSDQSKLFMGHGSKVEVAQLLPDGKRIAAGYGDGTVKVFDLKTSEVLHSIAGNQVHPVTAIDTRSDNNLIAWGCADGSAKILNCQSGKAIASFGHGSSARQAEEGGDGGENDGRSSVESVLFSSPEQNLLLTGTLNGQVTVWDISSQVSRHSVRVARDGIVKLQWRKRSSAHLLVATLDGKVSIIDYKAGKVVGECSGHRKAVLDFSQTSDGNHVVSCSDDGHCRIFNVETVLAPST